MNLLLGRLKIERYLKIISFYDKLSESYHKFEQIND